MVRPWVLVHCELQSDDKGAFTLGISGSRVESGNIMLAI
jgi:hypothetical protein